MTSSETERSGIFVGVLVKNFFSLVAAETFTKLITFAAFAYLARVCGPAGFGYVEWSAAILMCASLIVDQGFSSYGAREIAKNPAGTADVVAEIVSARFLLAGVGFASIVAFAFLFVSDQNVINLVLAYGLSLWSLPLLLQWVFQGHDRMKFVAITQIIRQSVFVAIVLFVVRKPNDLLFVGFAEVVGVTMAAVFSVWVYRNYFSGRIWVRPVLSRRLFIEGAPIGLSQMFWVVRMFGATLILGLVATPEDTGYFAAAMRILIALHTFVWLYFFNLLPSMSRAWVEGNHELATLIKRSIGIVATLSIGVGIVWVVVAPFVMNTVYGPEFAAGGSALQWMVVICVSAAISGHFRFGLIAADRQRDEMLTSAFGSLIAIVCVPIGYWQAGIAGSAAALGMAEVAVLGSSWFFAGRTIFSVGPKKPNLVDDFLESVAEVSK